MAAISFSLLFPPSSQHARKLIVPSDFTYPGEQHVVFPFSQGRNLQVIFDTYFFILQLFYCSTHHHHSKSLFSESSYINPCLPSIQPEIETMSEKGRCWQMLPVLCSELYDDFPSISWKTKALTLTLTFSSQLPLQTLSPRHHLIVLQVDWPPFSTSVLQSTST